MKRYGIWKITILSVSGEVVICEITARSGKDARKRAEARHEGGQILKMTRVTWLTGFSRSQLSVVLFSFDEKYGHALADILEDNGVFSVQEDKHETD